MGTKGVLAIRREPESGGKIWSTIIGVTNDGFPGNLRYLAETFQAMVQESPGDLTDEAFVKALMQKVCEKEENWPFLSHHREAQWVSHSACYNPFTGQFVLYEGLFEAPTRSLNIGPAVGLGINARISAVKPDALKA